MKRFLGLIVLGTCLAMQAAAYTEDEVAAARLQHIEGDFAGALEILLPAAEAGNPVAQNVLGVSYEDGMGLPVDPQAAYDWYKRAADQGMGKAMHNLGHLKWKGAGPVAADPEEARAWFTQAIAAGYGPAHANLGLMWNEGIGGPEDPERAVEIYRAGLAAGDAHSANNLGDLLRLGRGVAEDLDAARAMFARAGRMGLPNGLNNLGALYEIGSGVPVDYDTAFALYSASMKQGYGFAAFNIAELIEAELFSEYGPVDAYAHCLWALERVSDRHRETVEEGCSRLSQDMSATDQQAARDLAQTL
ncbi:tetratricopeptide repeat protein [Sulfitobacter aestuariivivens]|uniref:Sel1 repeat family protein n=1 Tax=Sulfitobacter aestuariivivens TaxID=2766981 RepID=A0A927HFE6_9RHOB|nr:tetratricopeptide repeat protein [Sulfitobacter aestuariivivens]MBD3663160.1 sel1 repeat family protein [Sulfitobacter aestuariivivens]